MPQYKEKTLFLSLLDVSQVLPVAGKKMIRAALRDETLPTADYAYLLDVMKMEQNLYAVVDHRADARLAELKKKYHAP